jgi:hypothetical protein
VQLLLPGLFRAGSGMDLAADPILVIGDDGLELRACLDIQLVLLALVQKGDLLAVAPPERFKQSAFA